MQRDGSRMQAQYREARVCVFEGEKVPGDGKRPVEIKVWRPDSGIRVVQPGDPDYEALCAKEGV